MAGKKTMTLKAIKDSGADIITDGIYYDKSHDRAYVKDPEGKFVYITSGRVKGDHKVMFYAAAGLRNYISKHGKRPDKKARNQIVTRAFNAEKTKALWKKRYAEKSKKESVRRKTKNPFRAKRADIKPHTESISIKIDSPKLSDIGTNNNYKGDSMLNTNKSSFKELLRKAVVTGTITPRSAASKKLKGKHEAEDVINELGLDLDPHYFTFYKAKNENQASRILIRITTKEGMQAVELTSNYFKSLPEMFYAADKIRSHILTTGKKPKKSLVFEDTTKDHKPIPSNINPPQKKEDGSWAEVVLKEQQVKSKVQTSIFAKLKMWIFG